MMLFNVYGKYSIYKVLQFVKCPYRVPTLLKWGISRVIKGSTAHFQGYFWKTVVTLLYVNKISCNFSNLFQDFVSVYAAFYGGINNFPKKMLDDRTVWNLERKKDICVDLFFVSFTNFKGIQGFYTKSQGSRSQKKIPGFSRVSMSRGNPAL